MKTSIYTEQKNEIINILNSIEGIGKVYDCPKNPTDEFNFKNAFVKNGVINTCWITRQIGTDEPEDKPFSSKDESNEFLTTQKDDQWLITLLYGYKDDDNNPSEYTFQSLVDAIEDAFRFQQNLSGIVDVSYPLQRQTCGIFQFLNGTVLCHKAEWKLILTKRMINNN